MNSKKKRRGQMSEAFCTAMFLSLSGGLQDVYTYLFRGKVFANAQTGNIVLLSANIMDGRWDKVLHYLVPLCAFALGVLAAEKMREHFQAMQRLHWRQLVVLGEVLLLFAVEVHGSIGLYRLALKWGWLEGRDPAAGRRRLRIVKTGFSLFFLGLGLVTLLAYVQLGIAHADRAGEPYVPGAAPGEAASGVQAAVSLGGR